MKNPRIGWEIARVVLRKRGVTTMEELKDGETKTYSFGPM
jgi:hypothetical protein